MTIQLTQLEVNHFYPILRELQTREDIYTFLQINKKCLSSLEDMPYYPQFMDFDSIFWMSIHFHPNIFNSVYFNLNSPENFKSINAKYYNDVLFSEALQINELTQDFAETYFPRVLNLYLTHLIEPQNEFERRDAVLKYVIKNADKFTSLEKVTGELEYIVSFLTNYTNSMKEKNLKFPTYIQTNCFKKTSLKITSESVELLWQLENMIPENTNVKVSVAVNNQEEDDEELIKDFVKIKFCFRIILQKYFNEEKNLYALEDGNLTVDGEIEGDFLNNLLNKMYASCVEYRYTTSLGSIEKVWSVPDCVLKFKLFNIESPRDQPFNIKMEYVKILEMENCSWFDFVFPFHSLLELTMNGCENITFTDQVTFTALKTISMNKCKYINFLGEAPLLETFSMRDVFDTIFFKERNFEKLTDFTIIGGRCTEFPNIEITGKSVYINSTGNFYRLKKVLSFEGKILNECPFQLKSDILEYPTFENEKGIFKMMRFISNSFALEIVDGILMRKPDASSLNFCEKKRLINTIFSQHFYSKSEKDLKFVITTQNGILKKKGLRYFEIEVTGRSDVCIGCFDEDNYTNFNMHLGWECYSIGYNGLDGCVYVGKYQDSPDMIILGKQYGTIVDGISVVGCGYNAKTKEVFFTRDGELILKQTVNWDTISAGVSVSNFNDIKINCGESNFRYMPKKSDLCCLV
ncbi:hypothetical protein EIN_020210 [Entamoeba invadens IP1]|uniref:hypothetical protein n=1 Tax=Entamoeba invadens IP1 TaxID=370355 RepID=UPI0002C3D61B|nr:hypothetical protein EIN_020210 [Entamoeba invadens IP1]ELP90572.1 hypothetical protein EIN_020210 [Entamoeba invadens IP1]|eukprot:XP_004257343.1 hypothetical protein EIN_020210 [Entamoeba invadens IP1]